MKRVWNSFETLCNLQDFEFYAHEFSWGLSSNQWCDEWLISKLYVRFATYGTDLDALSSKLKYHSDTFYDLFLFVTSIWTYSMKLFLQKDVGICSIAIDTSFLGEKYSGRGL